MGEINYDNPMLTMGDVATTHALEDSDKQISVSEAQRGNWASKSAMEYRSQGKPVRLVRFPIDVDSPTNRVADLKTAIEGGWLRWLKRIFEQVHGPALQRAAGQDSWQTQLDAAWAKRFTPATAAAAE